MQNRGNLAGFIRLTIVFAFYAASFVHETAFAGERLLKVVTAEGEVTLSVSARKDSAGGVEIRASGRISNTDPSHKFRTLYQLRQITSLDGPRVLLGNVENPEGVAFDLAAFKDDGRISAFESITPEDLSRLTRWSDTRAGTPGERLLGLIEVQVQVKNETTGTWLTSPDQPGTILYFDSWNKGTFTEVGTLDGLLKRLPSHMQDLKVSTTTSDLIADYVELVSMAKDDDLNDDPPFNIALGRAIQIADLDNSQRHQLLSTIRPAWVVDNPQDRFILISSLKKIAPELDAADAALVSQLLATSQKQSTGASSTLASGQTSGAQHKPDQGSVPTGLSLPNPQPPAEESERENSGYSTPFEAATAAVAAYRRKDAQTLLDMSVNPAAPELIDRYTPGTETYTKFFNKDSELSRGIHSFDGQFAGARIKDEVYVMIKKPALFSGPTYVHMLREANMYYYSPAEMVPVKKLPAPVELLPRNNPVYKEIEDRTDVVRKALASGSAEELEFVMAGDAVQRKIEYFEQYSDDGSFFGNYAAEAFADLVPQQLKTDAGKAQLKIVDVYRGETVYLVLSITGEPGTLTEVACCVIVAKTNGNWKLDVIRTMLARELPAQKFSF